MPGQTHSSKRCRGRRLQRSSSRPRRSRATSTLCLMASCESGPIRFDGRALHVTRSERDILMCNETVDAPRREFCCDVKGEDFLCGEVTYEETHPSRPPYAITRDFTERGSQELDAFQIDRHADQRMTGDHQQPACPPEYRKDRAAGRASLEAMRRLSVVGDLIRRLRYAHEQAGAGPTSSRSWLACAASFLP